MVKEIKHLSEREISVFCMEVSMLLNAGMPLEQAIFAMIEEEKTQDGKELMKAIHSSIEDGSTFKEALENTGAFPKYVTDMVLTGEKTGNLETIFKELHEFYEEKEELYDTIKSGVTYPFIMVIMMLTVLVVLVVKILPVFTGIYYEMGSNVPQSALVITEVGKIVGVVLAIVLGLIVIGALYSVVYSKINKGKKLFDFEKILMSKTKTGSLIAKARFASVLSMTFKSGIDVEYAMELAGNFIENPELNAKIEKCKEQIHEGVSLSDAIEKTEMFDPLELGILLMGMKSGNSEFALENIADRYSKQSQLKIARTVSAIEPVIVISLSVAIGVILLVVMMPLLGIMSAIR